jgi:hypothetical protein
LGVTPLEAPPDNVLIAAALPNPLVHFGVFDAEETA